MIKRAFLYLVFILAAFACKDVSVASEKPVPLTAKVGEQYELLYQNALPFKDSAKPMPRTVENNNLHMVGIYDWTSGFHPGSMWNLYALTKDDRWKQRATEYTELLDTLQYWEGTHDLGFMVGNSYGNALKYVENAYYDSVMVQAASSLSARFKPKAGVIQSWDGNDRWSCPVIIDNMMNLELLFRATEISGDSTYYQIAVTHADTTMSNHYRKDFSSYHVLDYDTESGEVLQRNTAQGYKDESAWARGQAWGLYGYVVMYRETQQTKYLEQARNISSFIMEHPNLPEDKVLYWDYDAPVTEDTPRDASAAAIAASALYELSAYVETDLKGKYRSFANTILETLSAPPYLADFGTNHGFLLKHATGHLPDASEIDVPINYADYYFLEALMRKRELIKE